jgi:hypothetical protein
MLRLLCVLVRVRAYEIRVSHQRIHFECHTDAHYLLLHFQMQPCFHSLDFLCASALCVRTIIGCGKSHRSQYRQSALMHACIEGHADCVRILVEAGAYLNFCASGVRYLFTTAFAFKCLKCRRRRFSRSEIPMCLHAKSIASQFQILIDVLSFHIYCGLTNIFLL